MKTCLITGAAGFVGSHLVEFLLDTTDWNIIALVRMSRAGNLNRLDEVIKDRGDRVKIVRHDLLDPLDSVSRHIGQVDYIVHMAADSHVDDSLIRRKEVFLNNTISTVNILEYAIKYQDKLERFIYYSTDEVFGDARNGEVFKEDDALNPRNPYSAGKASGEMACMAWKRVTGLPILIMRTMNMFGERQDPEKMIPKTIGRYLKGLPAIVHVNDGVVGSRHWLHAKNSASAVYFCLTNRVDVDKINVTGQVELDNKEISKRIADIMGIEFKYEEVEAGKIRPGYDRRYSVDGSRLYRLGWKPYLDFDKALEEVVKFSVNNPEWVR